jgi:hypothetical protein
MKAANAASWSPHKPHKPQGGSQRPLIVLTTSKITHRFATDAKKTIQNAAMTTHHKSTPTECFHQLWQQLLASLLSEKCPDEPTNGSQ